MDNTVKHCNTCKYKTSGKIYPDKCTYMNKEGCINKLSGRTCDYYQPIDSLKEV